MKRNNANDLPRLSPLERDVMNAVWNLTEHVRDCPSAGVVQAYQQKRSLAGTTIRTVLRNLRKKGYVEPVPTIERGMRLRPTVAREVVARRTLSELVEGFFNGSPRQAISFLLRDEAIDEDELAAIRRVLDEAGGSPSRRRKS